MTLAICIKCGGEKFGALGPCRSCSFRPTSDEELAKSMMVTDHHLSADTLRQIGADIGAGEDVQYSSDNIAQLVASIQSGGTRRMLGLEPAATPEPKPWWKFF